MNDKNRKLIWTNKDWAWLSFILFLIIVFLFSFRLSNNGYEIINIISLGAGISSIILAVVAIVHSIINNYSASDSLFRISEKVSLITEMFRKIDSVEKIVESLKVSSDHSDKLQSIANKKDKDLPEEDFLEKENSDLSGSFEVRQGFTRFHFRITLNENFDVFQFGEMLDAYFRKECKVPLEDYSITQNSLQGILLENPRLIDGCVIIKKHLDEPSAQLTFRGALSRVIPIINPKTSWDVVFIHIGYFES